MSNSDRKVPDQVPDDMPIPKAPIGMTIVDEVADEFNVDLLEFVEILDAIENYTAEHARDITERYTSKFVDDPIIMQKTIQQDLYVDSDEWTEIGEELNLTENQVRAAKEAHDRESRRIENEADWYERSPKLETQDVLVMTPPLVQDLIDGGLSNRQALVQAARMKGKTHDQIGTMLAMAPGTVKRHCSRIDRKIERAEKLIETVKVHDRRN